MKIGYFRDIFFIKVYSLACAWWQLFIGIINSFAPNMRQATTVYPKKYAHGFCFAVLCCGCTLTDFPIFIRLTSLALWQSNDCPSASKATLMNMDKYFMWINYERLHNHNKAKHNKTVCIFLGIYCIWTNDNQVQRRVSVALTCGTMSFNRLPPRLNDKYILMTRFPMQFYDVDTVLHCNRNVIILTKFRTTGNTGLYQRKLSKCNLWRGFSFRFRGETFCFHDPLLVIT